MLRHNKQIVFDVLADLNQVWLGMMTRDGVIVRRIIPAGSEYPGQEVKPQHWRAIVQKGDEPMYEVGLMEFADATHIKTLFSSFVPEDEYMNRYMPDLVGRKRIQQVENPALTICEHLEARTIKVRIHWGRDQRVASYVQNLNSQKEELLPPEKFNAVWLRLEEADPMIYVGGGEAMAPWENHIFRVDLQALAFDVSRTDQYLGFRTTRVDYVGVDNKTQISYTEITIYRKPAF